MPLVKRTDGIIIVFVEFCAYLCRCRCRRSCCSCSFSPGSFQFRFLFLHKHIDVDVDCGCKRYNFVFFVCVFIMHAQFFSRFALSNFSCDCVYSFIVVFARFPGIFFRSPPAYPSTSYLILSNFNS